MITMKFQVHEVTNRLPFMLSSGNSLLQMTKIMDERRPPESPGDLAWTKLLDENSSSGPVIVKIDDSLQKESPTSSDTPQIEGRRQSILGAFQRQIRLSLKAVSDSPGPITR